jgi:hypothetical protein
VPLRRHERNLRSRTFRSPLGVVFRCHGKRRAAWPNGTRHKGLSKWTHVGLLDSPMRLRIPGSAQFEELKVLSPYRASLVMPLGPPEPVLISLSRVHLTLDTRRQLRAGLDCEFRWANP